MTSPSEDIFPRRGSSEYQLLTTDKKELAKTLKRWKRLNKFFTVPLYRAGILPLFGIGKIFLLLYTKGRKTGKQRINPVEYRIKDGHIYIVSGRGKNASWFKNLLANPEDVWIKKGFRKFPAKFKVIENVAEKNEFFKWYVKKYPSAAKYLFGWDPKLDDPETADFSSFSKMIELLQLSPQKKK
ncbi:MAG: nitroreductase family deazaflavin-dependent oxidoreductase [Candidatus Heimdallarchaeaceae archaeon]